MWRMACAAGPVALKWASHDRVMEIEIEGHGLGLDDGMGGSRC